MRPVTGFARRPASIILFAAASLLAAVGCQNPGVDHTSRCYDLTTDGELDAALAECDRAVEVDDQDLDARLSRARLFILEDKHPLAIADLSMVIEADPENGLGLAMRGKAFFALGAVEQAKADLLLAIPLISAGHLGNTRLSANSAAVLADITTVFEELSGRSPAVADLDDPIALVAPWPIGRLYHDGERLEVSVTYVTPPGMKNISTSFVGVHAPGTPWYDYWCKDAEGPATCNTRMFSGLQTGEIPLTESSGTLTFVASAGNFPPESAASPPNLEGFVLCSVEFRMNDGVWGGSYLTQEIGQSCWP